MARAPRRATAPETGLPMSLRFHNTLTRALEPFTPGEPGTARVYACGPTVYQLPHIGNYRTFLFNDLLRRYLAWKGYDVRFVMNLTDVDDKTIEGALRDGVSLPDYTAPIIAGFHADLEALGLSGGVAFPRATEHIGEMVDLVARLVEGGHAYRTDDGSVYFDISSFPEYGRLSRVDLEATRAGAGLDARRRVSADEYDKADARDFVLWKAARDADREVGAVWPTPWGDGRPGWHIECSAMSMAALGESFDIHTGGEDLIFPHHEDEIAQSEAATGKPFVRYWLHVKHLKVDGAKMSKSKGNVFSLADLRERGYGPAPVRYVLLSAHYRSELNFTFESLDDARAAIRRLRDFAARLGTAAQGEAGRAAGRDARTRADVGDAGPLGEAAARALAGFEAALDDDLNVPEALGAVFTFVREGNGILDRGEDTAAGRASASDALSRIDAVLGVLRLPDADDEVDDDFAAWVEERIEHRQHARRSRDFATADAIRDELAAAGVVVEDTPQGPRWKKE